MIVRTSLLTRLFSIKGAAVVKQKHRDKTLLHVKYRFESTINAPMRIRLYTFYPSFNI